MADKIMLSDNLNDTNEIPGCSDALESRIAGAASASGERAPNFVAGEPVQFKGHCSLAYKELWHLFTGLWPDSCIT